MGSRWLPRPLLARQPERGRRPQCRWVSVGPRRSRLLVTMFRGSPIPVPAGCEILPLASSAKRELPRLRRVVLQGADYPVADLVAASSAVPGLLSPHRIDGHRYVDGGVRSMTSADRCEAADHLLVITPMAGPMFGPAGRLMEQIMVREMRSWGLANPAGQLWLIRPNSAVAALARRPDQLFDRSRALACYPVAYEQGRKIRQEWLNGGGPG
jgi:Patatin-like phospholipase